MVFKKTLFLREGEIHLFHFLKRSHSFIHLLREEGREEEKERNTDIREKHWLVASPHPNQGPNLQLRFGNWTGDLLLCRMMPNQLSLPARACVIFYHWILHLMFLRFIHILAYIITSVLFMAKYFMLWIYHNLYNSFINWWTLELFPPLGYYA